MGETVTITCAPKPMEGTERVSFNFSTIQLPKTKYLKWHITTKTDDVTNIRFMVKQQYEGKHVVKYAEIRDGSTIAYEGIRNLYIASPENVTGYFLVSVEAVEG